MTAVPSESPPDTPPAGPGRGVLRAVNALAASEWTAFFAAYVVLGVYLTEVAGFDDVGAGWAAGAFGVALCVLPAFAGAAADRLGFRRALAASYLLQAAGFAVLAVARSPLAAVPGLGLVAVGGAASRAVLLGTIGGVAPGDRTRAYALFLQFLNVKKELLLTCLKQIEEVQKKGTMFDWSQIMPIHYTKLLLLSTKNSLEITEGKLATEIESLCSLAPSIKK